MKNLCFDTLYKGGPVFTVIEVNRHYMSIRKQKWITLQKIAYLHWILTWKQVLSVSSVDLKTTVSRWIWLNLNINLLVWIFLYTFMCRDSNLLFCEIINWIIVLLISIWAFRNIRLSLSICRDLKTISRRGTKLWDFVGSFHHCGNFGDFWVVDKNSKGVEAILHKLF